MHLLSADMDRRAFVPLAARPAVAGAGHEVAKLVVAMILPDHDLAAGQPHVRKVAGGVDRRLVATIEAIDIGVHDAHRFRQGTSERIAHRWPSPSLISATVRPPTRACGRPPIDAATMNTNSSGRGPSGTQNSIESK